VHHILPKSPRAAFDDWLVAVADRAHEFFPLPDLPYREYDTSEDDDAYNDYVAPRRGLAVPPQLLDPDAACQPQQREELLAEFLAGLDPARNRYLRTPDAMKALGFTGAPYRL
jgi:hypothetical protein